MKNKYSKAARIIGNLPTGFAGVNRFCKMYLKNLRSLEGGYLSPAQAKRTRKSARKNRMSCTKFIHKKIQLPKV